MTPRLKKFIGVPLFLAVLVVYVTAAVNLADVVVRTDTHPGLAVIFYLMAGILWTVPAGAVIYWMQKPK